MFVEDKPVRKPREEHIYQYKFCEYCGSLHRARRRDKRYCSDSCRQLAHYGGNQGKIPVVNPVDRIAINFFFIIRDKLISLNERRVSKEDITRLLDQIDFAEEFIYPFVGSSCEVPNLVQTQVSRQLKKALVEINRGKRDDIVFKLSTEDRDFLLSFLNSDSITAPLKESPEPDPAPASPTEAPAEAIKVLEQDDRKPESMDKPDKRPQANFFGKLFKSRAVR